VRFYKYHALGNDYLVLNPADFPEWKKSGPSAAETRLLCHRHYGLGSDGILWGPVGKLSNASSDAVDEAAKKNGAAPPRQNGNSSMLRIYNPDGSEAEKSGNGLRIFARYLAEHGLIQGDPFTIQTLGGPAQVEIIDRASWSLRIGMGRATFASEEIPVAGRAREVLGEPLDLSDRHFAFSAASVGNPHCVIPLPEVSEELARRYGPEIETHPLFPNRINVQFMQVIDRANIRIEIWERGAGYTLASGSSSSAAAAIAHRLGLVDSQVTVHMPGGTLEIQITPNLEITMTGTVTKVSEGEISPDLFSFLDRV